MKKLNTILALVAAGLFLVSALSYHDSVRRAERFERGQRFLPNLNPDEIAQIEIVKGEETTRLRREGDRFMLTSADGYRAKNEAVNRFIKEVLDLSLEKEVGRGADLEEELGLVDGGAETQRITFKDSAGKEMVGFLVGNAFEDGSGSYVRRTAAEEEGKEPLIYLTSSRVYLSTGEDDFLDKQILDLESSELAAIEGEGFKLEQQEGELKLVDLPPGKKESTEVSQLENALSYLTFDRQHLADAPEVRSLSFDRQVTFVLADQSGYQVEVAEQGDKHYLRVRAFTDAGPVEITLDADEEEVKEKSETLVRADELQQFNDFHGSWVYEVSESTADKFRLRARDLIESA